MGLESEFVRASPVLESRCFTPDSGCDGGSGGFPRALEMGKGRASRTVVVMSVCLREQGQTVETVGLLVLP